jgi:hypothetical protein
MGARLTDLGYNRAMDNRTKLEDEIKTAEQHEMLKQIVLRLLDDSLHRFGRRSMLSCAVQV